MAGHFYAVTGYFDSEVSAAGGDLAGGHLSLPEAVGPVGRERAVGGAGDGIFVDALGGGEEAGDEVAMVAGSGDDDGEVGQGGDGLHVRLQGGHFGFRGEDAEKIARGKDGLRRAAEGGRDGFRSRKRQGWAGREVECVESRVAGDGQRPATRLKGDRVAD